MASASGVDDDGRGGAWRSRVVCACVEASGVTSWCARHPSDLFLLPCLCWFAINLGVSGMALLLAGLVQMLVDSLVLPRRA